MNTTEKNTSDPEKEEIAEAKNLQILMTISTNVAAGIFLLVFLMYFIIFKGNSFSTSKEEWGQFGDYVGGILNPTIAGLALFWLINSVNLQVKEFKKTNEALKETVKTAREQHNQIAIQNFENLFFKLLDALNNITNNIQSGSISTYSKLSDEYRDTHKNNSYRINSINSFISRFDPKIRVITGKESIKDHIIFYKAYCNHRWEYFYNEAIDDYFGSYFRTCYQILKLITTSPALTINNDTNTPNIPEQKKYFDFFRAQLSSYELEALFFNCLSAHGRSKFKVLIEKFGLFEHLLLDHTREIETMHRLTMYAYQYNKSVFESNQKWIKYYSELEKVAKSKKEINNFIKKSLTFKLIDPKYYISTQDPSKTIDKLLVDKKIYNNNHLQKNINEIKKTREEIKNYIEELNEIRSSKKNNILNSFSPKEDPIDVFTLKYRIRSSYNHLKLQKTQFKNNKKIEKLIFNFNHKDELFIIFKYRINFNEFHKFLVNSNNKFPE